MERLDSLLSQYDAHTRRPNQLDSLAESIAAGLLLAFVLLNVAFTSVWLPFFVCIPGAANNTVESVLIVCAHVLINKTVWRSNEATGGSTLRGQPRARHRWAAQNALWYLTSIPYPPFSSRKIEIETFRLA